MQENRGNKLMIVSETLAFTASRLFESVQYIREGYMHYYLHNGRNLEYDRGKAVEYAHIWAFSRNPAYFDFENFGGDCTNFASQCIYAGSRIMNFTPVYGWYYSSSYNRTASWTGVNFLYDFLINNTGRGPYAEEVDIKDARPGDLAQLSFYDGGGYFNHSPFIVQAAAPANLDCILTAAHTFNADYYPLSSFEGVSGVRYVHIKGVRS